MRVVRVDCGWRRRLRVPKTMEVRIPQTSFRRTLFRNFFKFFIQLTRRVVSRDIVFGAKSAVAIEAETRFLVYGAELVEVVDFIHTVLKIMHRGLNPALQHDVRSPHRAIPPPSAEEGRTHARWNIQECELCSREEGEEGGGWKKRKKEGGGGSRREDGGRRWEEREDRCASPSPSHAPRRLTTCMHLLWPC